ncbi:MAG: hypothetical protein ACHQJ6_08155, partial [Candidatus Berkiellales bacterium]
RILVGVAHIFSPFEKGRGERSEQRDFAVPSCEDYICVPDKNVFSEFCVAKYPGSSGVLRLIELKG